MTDVRILAVGVGDAAARSLRGVGRRVDGVDTVARALDSLDREGYECVLAAADLPDGEGFDLAEALAGRAVRVPTIVVGDAPTADVAERALEAGVTAYRQRVSEDDLDASIVDLVDDEARTYRRRRDRARIEDGAGGARCVVRDGRISAYGPRFEELVGAAEARRSEPVSSLAVASDREAVATAIDDATAASSTVRFTPAGEPQRTLELTAERSAVDGALIVQLDDVTEDVRREAALESDSDMLDALLTNVPLSIYFKDRQGRHERVSRFITHSDPEEYIRNEEGKVHPHPDDIIGKTDFDLYSSAFAEETVADDRQVLEEGEPIVDRLEKGTTAVGEDLYTSTTKAPRYDEDGTIVGLVGVTIDVTDRVQHSQELERQNERLDEFAEVLTHDLRNPLQIAQGHLHNVRGQYESDDVTACANALERMQSLIEEIRAFVIEGRTVAETEVVDLEAVAREAWSTVETDEATFTVDGQLAFRADPDRLRRLLENLFRNAVEHGSTSPGSQTRQDTAGRETSSEPSLTGDREDAVEQSSTSPGSQAHQDTAGRETSSEPSLTGDREDAVEHGVGPDHEAAPGTSVAPSTESGGAEDLHEDADDAGGTATDLAVRVVAREDGFSVEDDGVGLPEGAESDVFERGFTTDTGGTGFGLAIVRNIAEAHGWTIDAGESERGGACFTVGDVVRAEEGIGQTLDDRA